MSNFKSVQFFYTPRITRNANIKIKIVNGRDVIAVLPTGFGKSLYLSTVAFDILYFSTIMGKKGLCRVARKHSNRYFSFKIS